jgi:hypothetical protein
MASRGCEISEGRVDDFVAAGDARIAVTANILMQGAVTGIDGGGYSSWRCAVHACFSSLLATGSSFRAQLGASLPPIASAGRRADGSDR